MRFRRENKEDWKVSYIVIDGEEREAVCPTGAVTIKNETDKAWEILRGDKESTRVVVQIAPAVRVALGEKFGLARGEDAMGKIVAALKKIGADFVVDAAFAADIVAAKEAEELAERMKNGGKLPMFSASCPSWVHYAENRYPDLKEHFSSCRSPMQTLGEGLKKCFEALDDGRETKVIAVVSCAAEKCEEVSEDEIPSVDLVLTTDELSEMFAEEKIRLRILKNEKADEPFTAYTGAGILTGTAGGVTEAIVRALSEDKSEDAFAKIEYSGIRTRKEFREAEIQVGELTIKAAVVCGLKAADDLAEKIVAGESAYDFVEVSVCPDGCVSGGGQITSDEMTEKLRAAGLYYMDKTCALRSPEQNEAAMNFVSPEFATEFAEGFRSRLEKEQAENIEAVEEDPAEEPTEDATETAEAVEEDPAEESTEEAVETAEAVEEEPAEEPTEEAVETAEAVEEEPAEKPIEDVVETAATVEEEPAEEPTEEAVEAAETVEEESAEEPTEESVETVETVEEEPAEEPTEEAVEAVETVEEDPAEEPTEETAETTEAVEEEPAEEPTEDVAETAETVEEEPAEEPIEEVIETSNEEITEDSKEISRVEGEIAAADDITDDIEEEPLEELFEEDASESALEDGKDEEENVEEILTEQENSVEESVNAEAESEKDTLEDILEEVATTEDTAEETQETEALEEAEVPLAEDSVGQSEKKAEDTEIAVEETTEEITAEESEIVNSSDIDAMESEETSQDIDEEELNEETKENSPEPYHRTLSRKERRKLKRMRKFRN